MSEQEFTYPNFPEHLILNYSHFNHYLNFIESRKKRNFPIGNKKEIHHIVPKSLGGSNFKQNMITLTLREHYIAHLLLAGVFKKGMLQALMFMVTVRNTEFGGFISSRGYQRLRNDFYEYFMKERLNFSHMRWVNKEDEEYLIYEDQLEVYLSKGFEKGRKKAFNKGYRLINDGVNHKYVPPDQLSKYLSRGWVVGATEQAYLNHKQNNKNAVKGKKSMYNSEGKVIFIDESEVSTYLNKGWFSGQPSKGEKVVLYKDDKVVRLNKNESDVINSYLANGWNKGSGRQNNKNKVYINKDNINKMVDKEELPYYLHNGWELGKVFYNSKPQSLVGKIWINKNGKNKVIKEDKKLLQEYIDDGWKKGQYKKTGGEKFKGRKRIKKNGKCRYVYPSEIVDYINKGWVTSDKTRKELYRE